MSNPRYARTSAGMITRSDLLMLGISAGVTGGMIGGLMLGLGLALIGQGANIGLLLIVPAAPASALIGWIMARKLARRLEQP